VLSRGKSALKKPGHPAPDPKAAGKKPAPKQIDQQPAPPPPPLAPAVLNPIGGLIMGQTNNLAPVQTETAEDRVEPLVLVKTQAGDRMMPMREYDAYLADLEEDFKEEMRRRELDREKRREDRERRRKERDEQREEKEKLKKEFIVPQALFGKFESDDPYFTDKVFPPHLYPHLYPTKFPELFPHIYGDKIERMRAKKKRADLEKEDLFLFKDPRANAVSPQRKRTLMKILRRTVRTLIVFNLAWVNLARMIKARKQMSRDFFDEHLATFEEVDSPHQTGFAWLAQMEKTEIESLFTGEQDLTTEENRFEAKKSLVLLLEKLAKLVKDFKTEEAIKSAKFMCSIG